MKKIIALLITLNLSFMLISCNKCSKHKDMNNDNICDKCEKIINSNQKEEIEAPKNIKYDEETRLLTWDKVENAEKYFVEIMANSKIQYKEYMNDNYISIDAKDLFEKFFVGDKLEISVTAIKENSSKTTDYEHTLQQDFYYTDYLVYMVTKSHTDKGYKNVSSIDFLNFSNGIAVGKINHTINNKEYFTFFIKQDAKIKKVDSYKDFFYNFLVRSHGNNEFICGSLFENEYVKEFIIEKAELDISQYKEIFLFIDWNMDQSKYYSLCAITHDGKHEFYGLGNDKFIGSESYMIGKMKTNPESFYVEKYFELEADFEQNQYLIDLNEKLSEDHLNK